MQWLKRQQKTLSTAILSTLFAVAIFSVLSMCCGFSNHGTHHASGHAQHSADYHVTLCADSLPSQSSCHSEKAQEVVMLPQTRGEEADEQLNQGTGTDDSFVSIFRFYIPPEQKLFPRNFKYIPRQGQSKFLITQLPRSHLG